MPTLVRLLTALAILATVTFGVMAALVYFVEPQRTDIEVRVPLPTLGAKAPAAPPSPTVSPSPSAEAAP